jgi:hypothetical protein
MAEKRKAAEALNMMKKMEKALKNRENQTTVGRMVARIERRLRAQNTQGMTRQELRNAEAARVALNEHRAKKRRLNNAGMMRRINTTGTMLGVNFRARAAELKYQRMVAKVMRQATYTPTDFKQLGKVVRARLDKKWGEVERLIKEWEASVKKRACAMKKSDMKGLARGVNVNVARKNTRKTICAKIKNKL